MSSLVVPVVAWGLTRFLLSALVVLVGAFVALLTPCIDYVIPSPNSPARTPSRSRRRRRR